MASPLESMMPVASQAYVSQILVPPVCAWALQLIIGSVATTRALDTLTGSGGLSKRRSSVPHARTMLITAIICNASGILVCFWELADFATRQDRSLATIASPRLCRAIAPIPIGLTAAVTQLFMATRCWRLANRSIPFGLLVLFLISLGCGGALTFGGLLIAQAPLTNSGSLLTAQLFSWSSLSVDTIITVVLVYNLYQRKKEGQPSRAENQLNSLIRIAFETCAIPWFVVLAGSICGAVAFRYPVVRSTYWALCAVTPALYLLSFVYCLEATTNQLQPEYSNGDLLQEGGIGQCLCAQVRPFILPIKEDCESGHSAEECVPSGALSWSAPQEWGNPEDRESIMLPVLVANRTPIRREPSIRRDSAEGSVRSPSTFKTLREPSIRRDSAEGSVRSPSTGIAHRASMISLPTSLRDHRRTSMPRTKGSGITVVSSMGNT